MNPMELDSYLFYKEISFFCGTRMHELSSTWPYHKYHVTKCHKQISSSIQSAMHDVAFGWAWRDERVGRRSSCHMYSTCVHMKHIYTKLYTCNIPAYDLLVSSPPTAQPTELLPFLLYLSIPPSLLHLHLSL
jgi:hypothetical protein